MILLVGVIAALSGLAAASYIQADRCAGMGGRWDAAVRRCQFPAGESTGWSIAAILTGFIVAVAVGILLYRAMQFFTNRARGNAA